MENARSIMHVDVNSAYLSWTAACMLEGGSTADIRNIPSCIAGNPENRHGIILAKSLQAKALGVRTGESIGEARKKCPDLRIFAPDYDLYMLCSNAMNDILSEYAPVIERYSVDESFLDCSRADGKGEDPRKLAFAIKGRIKKELGFTVNIGVSTNKLLAKMAGELKKPDMVHSLFPAEIPEKMWPLDVRRLFMVGAATERKLRGININTIGELAHTDENHIKAFLKDHGRLIREYANGMDDSPVMPNDCLIQKSFGSSMTSPYDITDMGEAKQVLLALCERMCMRLRGAGCKASRVAVYLKSSSFSGVRHQRKLNAFADSTSEIYLEACRLLAECWNGTPVRQLGVSAGKLIKKGSEQIGMANFRTFEKEEKIDRAVDEIRARYGDRSVMRGVFANGHTDSIQGGVNDGHYLMMGGYSL